MTLAVPEVVGTLVQQQEHSLLWKGEEWGTNSLEEEGNWKHLRAEEDKLKAEGNQLLEGDKLLVVEGRVKKSLVVDILLLAGDKEDIDHLQGEDMPSSFL